MKNKIYIIRSNKKAFGGAEIYLDRLKDELTRQNVDHQIINSKVPKFLFSWLRVMIFNVIICLKKRNKFYFSLDRISCPDIFRAGDGVHKKYIQITNQTILKPLNFLYCTIGKKLKQYKPKKWRPKPDSQIGVLEKRKRREQQANKSERKTKKKIEHAVKIKSDEKLKNPAESKELLEKKRFPGYNKTKVRFVN